MYSIFFGDSYRNRRNAPIPVELAIQENPRTVRSMLECKRGGNKMDRIGKSSIQV